MVRAFAALRGPPRQSFGATAGVTIPPAWSALRPVSHGFDAIAVSLNLMRPLLGHDGLTAWYIQIAASLVAAPSQHPFSPREPDGCGSSLRGQGSFSGTL